MVEPLKQWLYYERSAKEVFKIRQLPYTTTIFRYYTFMRSNNCTLNMFISLKLRYKSKALTNQL